MTNLEPCLGILPQHSTLDKLAFPKEGDAWWIAGCSKSHGASAWVFADGDWSPAPNGPFRKPTTQESLEGSKKRRAHIDSVIASRIAQDISEVEDERILKEIEARVEAMRACTCGYDPLNKGLHAMLCPARTDYQG